MPNVRLNSRDNADALLNQLYDTHGSNIAGVDEVGRGSLCGDVVAACVVLPREHNIKGLRDSKKLSYKKRALLVEEITKQATFYGIGSCSNQEIDELNIFQATLLAAERAVLACSESPSYILCDGGLDLRSRVETPNESFVKGDALFDAISAASILAKVYRDSVMEFFSDIWPEYDLARNKGYATKIHIDAINSFGVTDIHRRSFKHCRNVKQRE